MRAPSGRGAITLDRPLRRGKPDGTVKSSRLIDGTGGVFTGQLNVDDRFGFAVTHLGDLDGDLVGDIAVGAIDDDDGG